MSTFYIGLAMARIIWRFKLLIPFEGEYILTPMKGAEWWTQIQHQIQTNARKPLLVWIWFSRTGLHQKGARMYLSINTMNTTSINAHAPPYWLKSCIYTCTRWAASSPVQSDWTEPHVVLAPGKNSSNCGEKILGGGFNPIWKILVEMGIFPK